MLQVSFEPIEWFQEIRDYQGINVEGRHLRANCRPANRNLLLNGKVNLRDFASIPVTVIAGQPNTEVLAGLSEKALGGIFYDRDQNFVYAWFFLKNPDSYSAVWDQVRDGGYLDCNITLGVGLGRVRLKPPEEWIWDAEHPLSIETVSFQFQRKINKPSDKPSDQTTPRTGLFGRQVAR